MGVVVTSSGLVQRWHTLLGCVWLKWLFQYMYSSLVKYGRRKNASEVEQLDISVEEYGLTTVEKKNENHKD